MTFTSDPPGATVLVDGKEIGVTPFDQALSADQDRKVTFRLAGHADAHKELTTSLEAGWLILDIVPGFVLGIVPIVIDASSGDWNGFDALHVHAVLARAGG